MPLIPNNTNNFFQRINGHSFNQCFLHECSSWVLKDKGEKAAMLRHLGELVCLVGEKGRNGPLSLSLQHV